MIHQCCKISADQHWDVYCIGLYLRAVANTNKRHLQYLFWRSSLNPCNRGHAATGGVFYSKVTYFPGGVQNSTDPTKPLTLKYGMSQVSPITWNTQTLTHMVCHQLVSEDGVTWCVRSQWLTCKAGRKACTFFFVIFQQMGSCRMSVSRFSHDSPVPRQPPFHPLTQLPTSLHVSYLDLTQLSQPCLAFKHKSISAFFSTQQICSLELFPEYFGIHSCPLPICFLAWQRSSWQQGGSEGSKGHTPV